MERKTYQTNHQVVLSIPPPEAFSLFTEKLDLWWPKEYTWSQDDLDSISIEPREGGRCTEKGPFGFQVDWGRVLLWQPPQRLVITWQISPNRVPQPSPGQASEVDVRFQSEASASTKVLLEHRSFESHGEGAEEYRDALAAEYGWPFILERFAKAATV